MALSLALCATVAFAQMPKNARVPKATKAVTSTTLGTTLKEAEMQRQESFKGSIFTKATLFTEDFSSTSTTYHVGRASGNNYQTAPFAEFHRVADTTHATLAGTTVQGWFPVLFSRAAGGQYWFYSLNGFESPSCDNGFMVMSMLDQVRDWGGNGVAKSFDSWIDFNGVTPISGNTYDVNFYQYYRRFNAVCDSTLVEYSSDSINWNRIYINRAGIDLSSNAATLGMKSVALPDTVANYSTLYLRLRYKSDSNRGGAYGYFWMLDDVSVDSADYNRITLSNREFSDGGYHLVPQGMGGNDLMWYSRFRNTGAINQDNLSAKIMHGSTLLAQSQTMNLVPNVIKDTFALIDPLGRMNNYWDGSTTARGTSNPLPSTTAGEDSIIVSMISDSLQMYLDTIKFRVNNDANGNRIWSRDNGFLCGQTHWDHACSNGYWSDDADLGEAGLWLCVRYFTPSSVPSDWVIRGVEIVGATMTNTIMAQAKLNGLLLYDTAGSQPNTITWYGIQTNASTHTVSPSEVNTFDIGYQEFGQYPTIRINFPAQPALEANRNYWVGYELAEAGVFVPATDRSYYFNSIDSTSTPLPNHWNRRFTLGSYGNCIIYQPSQSDPLNWAGSIGHDGTPMIRMIVGPRQQIPNYNITWNIRPANSGEVYDMSHGNTPVGGQTSTYPQGSEIVFGVQGDQEGDVAYDIDSVYVDGVAIDLEGDPNWAWETGYGTYTFSDLQADHNCVAVFVPGSIRNASNAVVKVQPNPASSVAKLTIEGVNGNVDYALIDINGRVISQKVINANATEQINLEGLARGTYFVRITNNNFTKVEKLIVR